MQTCEVCGWDTRADTRVCTACRRSQRDPSTPDGRAANAELLSAVLRSSRDRQPADIDAGTTADETTDRQATTDGTTQPPSDADEHADQIVLREITAQPESGLTADGEPTTPPDTSITTSLLEAFAGATPADTSTDDVNRHREAGTTNGDHGSGVTDLDGITQPGTTEPETATERGDLTQPERTADPDGPPEPDAATEPEATTEPDAATEPDELDADSETAADAPVPAPDTDTAVPTGTAVPVAPARAADPSAAEHEPQAWRDRARATFREMGEWTAVAQLGLLLVGALCVFQMVVLLVVLRFLLPSSPLDPTATADILVAHSRAMNVMLPVLATVALAVVALAVWCTRYAADTAQRTTSPLGVPAALWAMIAAAGIVFAVVVASISATAEQAARTTLLAIAASALLGAGAFFAPRDIAVTTNDAPEADDATPDADRAPTVAGVDKADRSAA